MRANVLFHVVTVSAIIAQIAWNVLKLEKEKQNSRALPVMSAGNMIDWGQITGNQSVQSIE